MEQVARQIVDRRSGVLGYRSLAEVLYALGTPTATVREYQRLARLAEASTSSPRLRNRGRAQDAHFDILAGAFDSAKQALESMRSDAASSPDLGPHYYPVLDLVRLDLEIGQKEEAGRLASDFAERHTAWSHPFGLNRLPGTGIPWLLHIALREGTLSSRDFD